MITKLCFIFHLNLEKNWKEIEPLSRVHHSNLSNNELFWSSLLKDFFFKEINIFSEENGFLTFWLVKLLTLSHIAKIAFFHHSFPDLLWKQIARGLNIFWKDVSPVLNVIVHSCQELILEATYSLGLLCSCMNNQDFSKSSNCHLCLYFGGKL